MVKWAKSFHEKFYTPNQTQPIAGSAHLDPHGNDWPTAELLRRVFFAKKNLAKAFEFQIILPSQGFGYLAVAKVYFMTT